MVMFGSNSLIPTSKRTWSFPFPVAPWTIASAFSKCAISTILLAMIGRAKEVPNKYCPSYLAPACNVGQMNSSTNSFFKSATYNFDAPQLIAFSSNRL